MNYYQNQLAQLKKSKEYKMTLRITDAEGNKTKCMDLNNESIDIIVKYLKSLKTK